MPGHRTELAAYDAMVGLARRLSLGTAGVSGTAGHGPDESGAFEAGAGQAGAAIAAEQVA
jgi:hypothetical protein